MNIRNIKDLELNGKTVFLRNDFNIPMTKDNRIADDSRIRSSIPTIEYLMEQGSKIICASHLGKPKGQKLAEFSLKPVADHLSELLGFKVFFCGETIGDQVEKIKSDLKPGQILLLENLRFHPGETANDESFSKALARNIDAYINDAFGTNHREHASIVSINKFIPASAAGLLLQNEIDVLSSLLEDLPENFVVVLGGSKVADKLPIINNFLGKARKILIGGAMSYTFLKAKGVEVGNSKVYEEHLSMCKDILNHHSNKIVLPVDHIAAIKIEPNITIKMTAKDESIPDNMMGLDIGMETVKIFIDEIRNSKLVFWNGPMGVFEVDTFSGGTMEIAKAVAYCPGTSILGGGDSALAVAKAGLTDKISHISTGGGACLEFVSGKILPGIRGLLKNK